MNTQAVSPDAHHRWLFAVWYPIIVPLAAWAIHLVAESALVRPAQKHHWVIWVMHGLSLGLAAVAVSGMFVAYALTRQGADVEGGEGSGTAEGRSAFLGWFGLYAAAFNLTLILAEEAIITWVHVHA